MNNNKQSAEKATANTNEVQRKIEVTRVPKGSRTLDIGNMRCGVGAKGFLSESKAKTLEADGYVKITGVA